MMACLIFSVAKSGFLSSYSCIRHYAVKSTTGGGGSALMSLGKGKKKAGGKSGAVVEKVVVPVETDTAKLVSYVCGSNIYSTGEDIKLKPDSEYPDWLWSLRIGKPPTLEQLDPTTREYWIKVRTLGMRRNNKLRKLRRFL